VTTSRPYGGKTREEREHERRERLFEAAIERFGTQGYSTTTIEQLCRDAGVTARHFYELFDTRESLLAAVYDRIVHEGTEAVIAALGKTADDPRARIENALRAFLTVYLRDPRKARIGTVEVVAVSPALEKRRRDTLHAFAHVIERQAAALAEENGREPYDFGLSSIALVGAVNEVIVEWLTRPHAYSRKAIVQTLVDLFLATVEGAGLIASASSRR
jgi:AcrR family transcriptional regulator